MGKGAPMRNQSIANRPRGFGCFLFFCSATLPLPLPFSFWACFVSSAAVFFDFSG